MPRKRDGFIPLGDITEAVELPGDRALTRRAPQALHHFTRRDQVVQLVDASEADAELGFMARMMVLCSLPRTNPGTRLQYKRVNGPYKLIMIAGGDNKLPYGTLPRLLLAWISTEAVRTQSRVLTLGDSLSAFMRKLDIYSTSGGSTGGRTRLRNQMTRLFRCQVELIHEHDRGEQSVASRIADRTELWWNERRPDERSLWESKIELGEKFFEEIIQHPIPLDINTLTALKRSSLGLDLYLWLTYRTFALKRPLRLPWPTLYRQRVVVAGLRQSRHELLGRRRQAELRQQRRHLRARRRHPRRPPDSNASYCVRSGRGMCTTGMVGTGGRTSAWTLA